MISAVEYKVRPGDIYVYTVPNIPDCFKVGKSVDATKRTASAETFLLDECVLEHSLFFADYTAAEKDIHFLLRDCRVKSKAGTEFFKADLARIKKVFEHAKRAQAPFEAMILKAQRGLGSVDSVEHKLPGEMAHLLNKKVKGYPSLTIKSAIGIVLSEVARCDLGIVKALHTMGLIVSERESMVLFDKSAAGGLSSIFNKTRFKTSWQNEFSIYAGFDQNLKLVLLDDWLKQYEVATSSETVEKVKGYYVSC